MQKQVVAKNPIIEEIHQQFSSEESKLIKRIRYFQKEVEDDEKRELAEKLKDKGFGNSISVNKFNGDNINKAQNLANAIEQYNVDYPTKKFITEDALYEICAKYGLIITTPDRYTGFIPYEKQKEIVEFKLKGFNSDLHHFYLDINEENEKFLKGVIDKLHDAICYQESSYRNHGVMSVNSELFTTLSSFIRKYDENIVNFVRQHYNYNPLTKERYPSLIDNDVIDFRNRNIASFNEKYNEFKNGSQYVMVASKNLIDMSGMRVNNKFELVPFIPEEEFDKLRKEEKEIKESEERRFFTQDDPIFLAKVKYGYIIVSAWGEEAEDPLVVNHKFN
jgi:hypothetical protein